MSKELDFIKEREGAQYLDVAKRQQKQLSYFLESSVQEDVSIEYFKTWAERNYRTDDVFFNWVKTVFRKENFLSFYKYLRFPLPSSKIVNDEIKPQLKRVYFADDSYFKYTIKGKEVEAPEELDSKNFEEELFNALLFNHNDIIVHDLNDVNSPYREIVSLSNIVAIDSDKGQIEKVAYTACINDEENNEIHGYLYIDSEKYMFFDSSLSEIPLKNIPHDLGRCPAMWISNEAFSSKNDVVRKSIFSYAKRDLEKYVFLNTLLEMSEPNGAIPTTVKIKTSSNNKKDIKGENKEPMASNVISSQQAEVGSTSQGSESFLQTGTQVNIPLEKLKDGDGKYDFGIIQNFAKQFHLPVEQLNYVKERLKEMKADIIQNILGDYSEQNQSAKNELQVGKSYVNKQDKLRDVSIKLSKARSESDKIMLGLKYGNDKVEVSCFYGSDFFLDNESDLFTSFKDAPNPIERRNLLKRIGKTRYRFNPALAERTTLLYSLMPFSSDVDYDKAVAQGVIDNQTKQLQLQFDYWVAMFEAEYGDILQFYNDIEAKESEKLIMIKNLMLNLIKPIENGTKN